MTWTDLPSQTAETEELSFKIEGLSESTDYEVEISTDSSYPEASTYGTEFRTLHTVNRNLASVTLNGNTLSGWDYENEGEFSTGISFSAYSGSVTVSALAVSSQATVEVSPSVYTNVTNNSTVTFTITVTDGGQSQIYTLNVRVTAYPTTNISLISGGKDIEWSSSIQRLLVNLGFGAGVDVYRPTGHRIHSSPPVFSGSFYGAFYHSNRVWLVTTSKYRSISYSASGFGTSWTEREMDEVNVPNPQAFFSWSGIAAALRDNHVYVLGRIANTQTGNASYGHMRAFSVSVDTLYYDGSRDVTLSNYPTSTPGIPRDIAWGDNQWWSFAGGKVLAWGVTGFRNAPRDFDLHENNTLPAGIAYVDVGSSHLILVADASDALAYAYRASDGAYVGAG